MTYTTWIFLTFKTTFNIRGRRDVINYYNVSTIHGIIIQSMPHFILIILIV